MKELILLIRSLNKQEKKYFREKYSGEKPMQLFDFIDKNKLVDAATIKRQPFYNKAMSNRLQTALLKSLRELHEGLSDERKIDNILHEFDILVNKKLFRLAEKKIKDAIGYCLEKNKTPRNMLRLDEALRFVQRFTLKGAQRREGRKAHLESIKLVIKELQLSQTYLESFAKMDFPEEELSIEATVKAQDTAFKAMSTFANVKPVAISYYRYVAQLRALQKEINPDASLDEAKRFYDLVCQQTDNTGSVRDDNSRYKRVFDLMMVLVLFIQGRKLDLAYNVYETILRDKNKDLLISHLLLNQFLALSIDLLLRLGKTSEAIELMEKQMPQWDKHLLVYNVSKDIVLFCKSMAYFCNGNFKKANKHIQEFLSLKVKARKGVEKMVYHFEVLVFYELDKLNLLLNRVSKLKSKLKKEDNYTAFDEVLCSFAEHLVDERKDNMQEDYEKAVELFEDVSSRLTNGSEINIGFNFIGWMDNKVNGVPFRYKSQ